MQKVLLFQKDYTDRLHDRYFVLADGALNEVQAEELVGDTASFICHDYWLIAQSLFRRAGALPLNIIDVEEFRIATCGSREERRIRERVDISKSLAGRGPRSDVLKRYVSMFNRAEPLVLAIYEEVGLAIAAHWKELEAAAGRLDEANRYSTVEQPVISYLMKSAVDGIAIDRHGSDNTKRTSSMSTIWH